jgi:hypothetical protein
MTRGLGDTQDFEVEANLTRGFATGRRFAAPEAPLMLLIL